MAQNEQGEKEVLEPEWREPGQSAGAPMRPPAGAMQYAVVLTTALALSTVGVWLHVGIKQSLRDMRAAGLQSVLDVEVQALHVWIREKLRSAQRRADDPRVRAAVEELVMLAPRAGDDTKRLCASPARARVNAFLKPFRESEESVTANVVDRTGLVIATPFDEYCGRRVSLSRFFGQLDAVFGGQGRFVRPFAESQRFGNATLPKLARPLVWFEAPVRDGGGRVIGALGFGEVADATFGKMLQAARPGETGEVFAFDESGVMLSDSRFLDDLRRRGLVAGNGAVPLSVPLGEPAGSATDIASRSLTQLAARAIAARQSADPAQQRGVILDPYRSYHGTAVIGAWRWLPDLDFGVAVEMSADEAYAPLGYLHATYWAVFGALMAAVIVALLSSWSVVKWRLQARHVRRVGPYTIERQIGEGGMATVYLARHALLRRPTAIKILRPHMATDEIQARFRREVEFAAQLSHPNNIEIYDYGRTRDGVFYYAMEYLVGLTLAELVARSGPVAPGRSVHVLRQLCAALREVHGRGLVHRDIKPENIMLCERGGEFDVVKVLDFGIVKSLDGAVTRDLTRTTRVLGTPAYMAPERLRDPADVDARADIYAVGAVGFFLLTGQRPFEGGSDQELAQRIVHVPVPPPSKLAPFPVPPPLDDLILRCMAKERDARPGDVAGVIALLDGAGVRWSEAEAREWWQRLRRDETAAGKAEPGRTAA